MQYRIIDPGLINLQKRIDIRQQFLNKINKHTSFRVNTFSNDTMKYYQSTDSDCKIIIKYIKNKNQFSTDPDAIAQLKDFQTFKPELYTLLFNDCFKLNSNGIIVIEKIIELDKQKYTVIFVPLLLRKIILDYSHHSIYKQHYGPQQTFDNIQTRFYWINMKQDCFK